MAESTGKTVPDWMRARLSVNQRFLILCIVAGLLCGIAAVLFHFAIEGLFHSLWHFASHQEPRAFIAIMIAAPTLGGLLVGLVGQRFIPETIGSGIPQTKYAYYNKGGKIRSYVGLSRLILGSLYIGLGNSLGREGPTVHISAAIASRLGRWGFRDATRVQSMLPVGMAAGIAAAFNAPLSALTFVFEELLDNFSMKALGGMVIAVVTAAAVSRSILGEDPILTAHLRSDYETSAWMLIALPLGVTAGLLGHLFTTSVLSLRGFLKKRKALPAWLLPASGGLSCGLLGVGAYFLTGHFGNAQNSVFSIGYESLEAAFLNELTVPVLATLLLFKFLAVVLNYASGGSGGLFSPTLFLGGLLGALAGIGFTHLHHLGDWVPHFPPDDKVIGGCVLLGMGAMFASVIGCRFTSLIIIFEMTGNYDLILPLMAGNMLAWQISKRLRPIEIYNSLLLQDGITLRSLPAYRGARDYRELPVQAIMTHDVFQLKGHHTAGEALARIREKHKRFHGYPVVGEHKKLLGVVTHHELRDHPPETLLADLVAEQELLSVTTTTTIRDAAHRMIEHDYQQVPVVSPAKPEKLLGWLTANDIARQQNAIEG
ncbi:chloride channel protein [Roseibacillus ishigakijimensis]|uniref:Chloride channel protein n=1 Tax=Roseibacillus ishigakijimensis TaxID=454146 RepID=A0A934RUD1_9BACT|nr:chloride channel protein [Roseibacillus ishigakijimensis]MBK1834651.1 chloride channel protein [Roseibacillus ishigakijimensis]